MSFFGFSSESAAFTAADRAQLIRLEQKLDLLLAHFGIEVPELTPPTSLSPEVQALARDPASKIQAIALYRQQTGSSLAAAKAAIENFARYGQ